MIELPLEAVPKVLMVRQKNVPLLAVIVVLYTAVIAGTGLYTGAEIGQRRGDNQLVAQRLDYEARLIQQDTHHDQEIKRLTTDTASLQQALGALTTRINERAAVADQTRVTASAAYALAASAVAAHHDVTRSEFAALSAKTAAAAAVASRSASDAQSKPTRADFNALSSKVEATEAQTQATARAVEKPKDTSWWGGKK